MYYQLYSFGYQSVLLKLVILQEVYMFMRLPIGTNIDVQLHPESDWHIIDTFLQTYDLAEVRGFASSKNIPFYKTL